MLKRVFSRQTYNGYHLVNFSGEGEDPSPIGFFKKTKETDEHGFLADENDIPECLNKSVNKMGRPWGEFIFVPSLCQKCIWVYRTPDDEFDCLLITKEKRIHPSALLRGTV